MNNLKVTLGVSMLVAQLVVALVYALAVFVNWTQQGVLMLIGGLAFAVFNIVAIVLVFSGLVEE